MHLISHRRNTIQELRQTPVQYGVEIDIRSAGSELILHHDPFSVGEPFDAWLNHFQHGTLILNVKEEGLETRTLELLSDRKIDNFFFLDQSFPFLMKTALGGERRAAVRVSEYENIDTALTLGGKIEWVWVDCFNDFPISKEDADRLKRAGFKLCLVSPELQGRTSREEISTFRDHVRDLGIVADAVCTKRPDLWESNTI